MKREIKFRGKGINHEKWVYGYYYVECGNTYIIENRQATDETKRNTFHPVHPETVGQFTGLRDMDGTEIYEDDILAMRGGFEFPVVFSRGCFCVKGCHIGELASLFPYAKGDDMKIIGNIYETPIRSRKGGLK